MKRLIFTLLACCVAFGMANAAKTLTIHNGVGAITLDGTGDEDLWTAPAFNDMDQNKGDATNKNNTSKFKMTYDKDYVYVYAEVLDSKIDTSQSTNVWEKDCIEVFFALDTTSQAYTNSSNATFQLRKVFGRDMTDYTAKGFAAQEADMAGGKSQEWQLAWDSIASTIKDAAKWDNMHFRFEIQNGDNDASGRNSQLFWNANADDQWNHTKNMGTVVTEYYVGINTPTVKSTINFSNNVISTNVSGRIDVISMDGRLVMSANNVNELNVSVLRPGVYAAKAGNAAIKFYKK